MATATDFALTLIGWVSNKIDRLKIRGMVRTAVQAWWAVLLTQEWALELLDFVNGWIGDYEVTSIQATVFTMAVLWKVGDYIQNLPVVQSNAIGRSLMILIMGGGVAPNYAAA